MNSPRILIDLNQYKQSDVADAYKLKCDGVWFVSVNSSDMTDSDWVELILKIGTRRLITEEGGINPDDLWTKIDANTEHLQSLGFNPNSVMVYHEFPYVTLTKAEVKTAFSILNEPILPLIRSYIGEDRMRLGSVLSMPLNTVPGIAIEIAPIVSLIKAQRIVSIINSVINFNKKPWLLIAPQNNSVSFEQDIHDTLTYLKSKTPNLMKCNVILGAYELENKHATFLGPTNSVEQALKVTKHILEWHPGS